MPLIFSCPSDNCFCMLSYAEHTHPEILGSWCQDSQNLLQVCMQWVSRFVMYLQVWSRDEHKILHLEGNTEGQGLTHFRSCGSEFQSWCPVWSLQYHRVLC